MKTKTLITIFITCIYLHTQAQNNVPTEPNKICPLLLGASVPDVSVFDPSGANLSLKNILNSKKTVLLFFRGSWCPYCTSQLADFRKVEGQIQKVGYQIIAIGSEKFEAIKPLQESKSLSYKVYADASMQTQIAFGIAFRNEQTILNYNGLLQNASGQEHGMLPVPSVFIIDNTGKIIFSSINPDYTKRISAKAIIAILPFL